MLLPLIFNIFKTAEYENQNAVVFAINCFLLNLGVKINLL